MGESEGKGGTKREMQLETAREGEKKRDGKGGGEEEGQAGGGGCRLHQIQ